MHRASSRVWGRYISGVEDTMLESTTAKYMCIALCDHSSSRNLSLNNIQKLQKLCAARFLASGAYLLLETLPH